jgi:hydroxyacylglutathione hydrolase
MHEALTKLGGLPEDTLVFNGHEYTKGSAKFGLTIEPDNKALKGSVFLVTVNDKRDSADL